MKVVQIYEKFYKIIAVAVPSEARILSVCREEDSDYTTIITDATDVIVYKKYPKDKDDYMIEYINCLNERKIERVKTITL